MKKQQRLQQLQQQPQNLQLLQASNSEIDEDDDSEDLSDLDFQQGYRRPKLVVDKEAELSDYIAIRLAVSRAKAMQKYREIYT
jgi:hypothetical protein